MTIHSEKVALSTSNKNSSFLFIVLFDERTSASFQNLTGAFKAWFVRKPDI